MPKEIKAIKCPHCGSVKHTAIKEDHYRCENCHTEYYLDSDDIYIHHTVTHRPENNFGGQPYANRPVLPQKVAKYVLLGFILTTAIAGAAIFLGTGRDSSTPKYAVSEAADDREERYTTWSSKSLPVAGPAQEPRFLVVGSRNYMYAKGEAKNGVYVGFHDPVKQSELKAIKLDVPGAGTSTDEKLRRFGNGEVYAIIDKSKIFKIDVAAQKATDVSTGFYQDQPLLQAGVATVEFLYDNYGDGLAVMTNDGKSLFYYPLANKVYTKDEMNKAQEGFKTLLPNAKEQVYYTFSRSSSDFPDEKIQLLRIVYKENAGGPRWQVTGPSWGKDYQVRGSGIYVGNIPFKKVLISEREKNRGRIVSYKDITPDRLYFSPKVLFSDANDLLICFKANAAPTTPYTLQCLHPETGAIKWTTPLAEKKDVDEVMRYKDGFVAVDYHDAYVFNTSGKLVSHYETK